MSFLLAVKNFFKSTKRMYLPRYRLLAINETDNNYFCAEVQLIGTDTIFKMLPEEILMNDSMTELFSPTDIRALTYLGYTNKNSPQYKILAQKLSDDNARMLFAVKKRGDTVATTKTVDDIAKDKELLYSLSKDDVFKVGFLKASEHQDDSIVPNTKPEITQDTTHLSQDNS